MKKSGLFGILLGVVLLALTGTSRAQIVITSDEYMLDVGTVFEQESTEDPVTVAVDVGSPGGPQVWDFTSQVCTAVTKCKVVEKTATPFAAQFPSANYILETDLTDTDSTIHWQYHQVEPSYGEFQGWGWQTPDTSFYTIFSPPRRFPLPLAYGLSHHYEWGWSDTMEIGPPAIIVNTYSHGHATVDGWGTVKVPLGEYETLRICSFDTCSAIVIMGGDTISRVTTTHISYSWLSEDVGSVVYVRSEEGEVDPDFTQASGFNRLKSFTGIFGEGLTSLHPGDFQLGQNYPNPCNPSTTIRYHLPAVSHQRSAISLKIYDILGQEVRTLVDEEQPAGDYRVLWDGSNEAGAQVASGVYLYKLSLIHI